MADPGFPVGGREPPTQALFSENVYKNERIGSYRGWRAPGTPPRSANDFSIFLHMDMLLTLMASFDINEHAQW